MSDPEIGALRAKLAARPRSDDYRQRRKDIDQRGLAYRLATDIGIEPVTANGVRAEWTTTPNDARDAALMYLHGGGYVIGSLDSHRHLVAEAGRACGVAALALDYRLAPEHPFPAAVDDALAGYRFPFGTWDRSGADRDCRRQRRWRPRGFGDGGDPRRWPAAACLRLVHFAVGRYGGGGRDDDEPRRERSDRAARRYSRHGKAVSERR